MAGVSYAVDVSNNNGSQDWGKLGVHLGIVKASEGEHTKDTKFAAHMDALWKAGVMPGAYHFAWPNQDAKTEAANYVAAVKDHRVRGFLHFLDLERYPNGGKNYAGRSSAQIRAYATAWITAVKAAFPGDKVGVYTSGDDLAAGHYPSNSDMLWYPAYPVQGRSFAQAAKATRPKPSGKTVWGWQFTSQPIDRSIIYTSPADLEKWAAGDNAEAEDDDMATMTDAEKKALAKSVAGEVWGFENAKAGDKRDMRQALVNAEGNTAKLLATVTAQAKVIELLSTKLNRGDTDPADIKAGLKSIADEIRNAHPAPVQAKAVEPEDDTAQDSSEDSVSPAPAAG